jgi:phenylalanyl-tRNA synthetase beta chain
VACAWSRRAKRASEASTARRHLAARDLLEAVNYAFVDESLLATWHAMDGAVPLANPLSAELGVMRTQLLPGLVAALARNLARQQGRVRLFELGNVFRSADATPPLETQRIAPSPAAAARSNGRRARNVDFHDLKGDLESLAALSARQPRVPPLAGAARATRALGRRACDERRPKLGWIGQLHPRLQRALDLDVDVVAFELDLDRCWRALRGRGAVEVSVRPPGPRVRRPNGAWAASGTVQAAAGASLRDSCLFDSYAGRRRIQDSRVSLWA